ncbi:hypothetical protein, partial [Caldalkalibacillus thermarum]|uniref:hypothetical protein n=1 Tax=Caldalkalibacillus thermarum TaxID=296745 RepID=UPI001E2EB326
SLVDVGLDNFILPKDWVFFAFFDQIPQLNQGILVFFKVRKLSTIQHHNIHSSLNAFLYFLWATEAE